MADSAFEGDEASGLSPPALPRVGDRYELRAQVGQGAFGIVYEAFDRELGALVALKELLSVRPETILAFKREFRTLAGIRHPNIVRFYELFENGGRWFFTMELARGDDFAAYATKKPRGPLEEDRLRSVFGQLAAGLAYIHARGIVHGDVKPANLRVTEDARVVLVDFGLSSRLARDNDRVRSMGGTAAYMAPEQVDASRAAASMDMYAVGVMLYEALTGVLPFLGSEVHLLLRKRGEPPAPPSARGASCSLALEHLCMALLARDPRERPSADQVAEALRGRPLSLPPGAGFGADAAGGFAFVGRNAELATLLRVSQSARAGRFVLARVTAESGMGKTALVHELTYYRSGDIALLPGRCREREAVPYNALDGAVDALAEQLGHLPQDELRRILPKHAGCLAQLFPVLGAVSGLCASGEEEGTLPKDPGAQRVLLFTGFRELVTRLAAARPTVLVLEDLQWADAESVALLDALLSPPAQPALFVLITTRTPRETPGAVNAAIARWQRFAPVSCSLELGALSAEESRELVQALVPCDTPAHVEQVVREARGHPLFIETLARYVGSSEAHLPIGLDEALRALVSTLNPDEQRVLSVVCLAGAPLSRRTLVEVSNSSAEEALQVLSALCSQRLVRVHSAAGRDALEPYHERIRELVVRSLRDDERTAMHRRLAMVLEAAGDQDEVAARNWELAFKPERAALCVVRAADAAMRALAFDKAAGLYDRAISLGPPEGHPSINRSIT